MKLDLSPSLISYSKKNKIIIIQEMGEPKGREWMKKRKKYQYCHENLNCTNDSMLFSFNCMLFLFPIFTRAKLQWTPPNSINIDTIMETILESCYETMNSSNPILIFGDSNKSIIESSIIRMNNSFNFSENYQHKNDQLFDFKASKIVVMSDSFEDLFLGLGFLQGTQWWDYMAPLFIIEKTERTCKNFLKILNRAQKMNIVASIYICKLKEKIILFTSNPIANYAPYPWRRIRGIHDINVFRQVFNESISCKNLDYDRMKFLNGHEIKIVGLASPVYGYIPGKDYCKELSDSHEISIRVLLITIRELNATCRLEFEQEFASVYNRLYNSEVDMYKDPKIPDRIHWDQHPHFFAALENELIAVVKLKPEMSTLQKLLHLWSPIVLYSAVLVLLILFLILIVKNRDFSSAMLDMVRFLTYSTIATACKSHSFRIYFTTMLIFIIISNGVFQGKIAAFLSTLEKIERVETVDELIELKYTFYTFPGNNWFMQSFYPNSEVKEAMKEDCINFVLNSTSSVCVINRQFYEEQWALLPVETVEIPYSKNLEFYETRDNWPLLKRIDSKLTEITEAGLINFWRMEYASTPLKIRKARKIELSVPRNRPIKLYKLDFAFHLLGIGLMLSIIAFLLELMTSKM